MRSHRCIGIILVLLAATAVISMPIGDASAQELGGSLQGTVYSRETGPEPEVQVVLSGPELLGSRVTWTDRHGFFQFVSIPPGVYELELTRMGLRTLQLRAILVELGRTTALPAMAMAVQPIMMTPLVTEATRIHVDPVRTAGGGTLDDEDYAILPVDRDYKSIITVLPGANQSYRGDAVNVGGSTGLENQFYIDGVNVTDTRTGGRATSLPYNFVRAVEVKTGGYEAQYGRALGAVVNALTYSGTNDFEAQVFGFTQPGRLSLDSRTATEVEVGDAVVHDWGARVSGPVARDRLWFSAAVNPRADGVDKEIAGHGRYNDRTEALRFAGKLTWRASEKSNLTFSVFGDPTSIDRVESIADGIATVSNPDPLLARIESGGVVGSVRATVAPHENLLVTTGLARQWDRFSDLPATAKGAVEPLYLDYVDGTMGGGRAQTWEGDRRRTSITARATYFLPGHTIVAGAEYEDARVFNSYRAQVMSRIDVGNFFRAVETYSGTFHNRSPVLYLQDTWRVSERLTLSPGIRWSAQYLAGASGQTAQSFTGEWQPRAGISWQLDRDGRQRVFGSYGRFYQTIPPFIAEMFYVDYLAVYSFFSSDPREPGSSPDEVIDGTTSETDWAKQIDGLRTEHFDEFTLGYERIVGSRTKLTLRAIRRDLRSSFQWGLDLSRDPIWVLGTPGKGDFSFLPPPKREYTAIEIGAEGESRAWRYRTSYVISRSWGNYPGLFNSDFGFEIPGGMSTFFMPHQAQNSTGHLPNDRTHVFKFSGGWSSGFGLDAGTVITIESGGPVNDFGPGPMSPLQAEFLAPRGSAGRTPALWNVDLRLAYDLPISRELRTRLLLDLLHVGNPRRPTKVDELHYLTLDENGDPASVNPNYKRPTAHQPPMAARVGVQIDL